MSETATVLDVKKGLEQIGRNFEEMKAANEQAKKDGDVLLQEKLAKLTEDISAKHEALQTQLNAIEAKAKRPQTEPAEGSKAQRDAEIFAKHRRAFQGQYRQDFDADAELTTQYEK